MTVVEGASVPEARRSRVERPDALAKAQGRFTYTADLWAPGMLWCVLVRSPHAHARVLGIETSAAYAVPGVHAVLTAADLPGDAYHGSVVADRPVLASDVVRFAGEAVVAIAAETPHAARRAAEAVRVDYEPLDARLDPEHAFASAPLHPDGNVFRHIALRHGRPVQRRPDGTPVQEIVVEGLYEIAAQDQANPATDAVLALPCADGGVELHVATQWPHSDRDQVAQCIGLAPGALRLMPAGVGGSSGTREDIGLLAVVAWLAARTGRPVKSVVERADALTGGGHRHAARLKYTHRADSNGRLLAVEAQILLDGGAYATSSPEVVGRLAGCATGPYMVQHAAVDVWAVRTNNPPAGTMRGPGATQVCFAYEAQMDKLAAALGMNPVELRLRNALSTGTMLTTGQILDGPAPAGELLRAVAEASEPPEPPAPGLRRGVGYAVGLVPLLGIEGADEASTATVRLDHGVVTVTCAAVEVGQGFTLLARQIVERALGIPDAIVLPAGTALPSAGPPGLGRHTMLTAGAVHQAVREIRTRLLAPIAARYGMTAALLDVRDGRIVSYDGLVDLPASVMTEGQEVAATAGAARARHTEPLDDAGQGDAYPVLAFAACRVVADVDPDTGAVRIADVTGAYDAGRVLDPVQALSRVEGAVALGVGLALVEDLGAARLHGPVAWAQPGALDLPPVRVAAWHEDPQPDVDLGAKGLSDAAAVPVPAAIAAAVRAATGAELPTLPLRPRDVAAGAAPTN
ncbi:xanthine dehydrogenase family protein molybdopterin-binding subunit [Yinghuangia seranimata]|uniref:xanthine dehydrogenase family protein molybdopterin-binding subunit n=1 Tax=Yinghuangia seranimata TaxID=408067 RepID=UPI00248CB38D|nr:molybdopterin cofactor-binding domain-containing protein [Yinghuangia seranimata]MDI2131401.1 molybdopterin-dependent oxidoreductase [Yinghuangia seranimata]